MFIGNTEALKEYGIDLNAKEKVDLISRKALIEAMEKKYEVAEKTGLYAVGLDCGFIITERIINEQPPVEAVPVVWIKESMGMRKNINTGEFVEKFYCTCPICGYMTGNQGTRFNFCPECGADMRKKVQE